MSNVDLQVLKHRLGSTSTHFNNEQKFSFTFYRLDNNDCNYVSVYFGAETILGGKDSGKVLLEPSWHSENTNWQRYPADRVSFYLDQQTDPSKVTWDIYYNMDDTNVVNYVNLLELSLKRGDTIHNESFHVRMRKVDNSQYIYRFVGSTLNVSFLEGPSFKVIYTKEDTASGVVYTFTIKRGSFVSSSSTELKILSFWLSAVKRYHKFQGLVFGTYNGIISHRWWSGVIYDNVPFPPTTNEVTVSLTINYKSKAVNDVDSFNEAVNYINALDTSLSTGAYIVDEFSFRIEVDGVKYYHHNNDVTITQQGTDLSDDTSINSITFVDLNNQQIAMTFENNQWVCEVDNTVNRGTFNLSLGHDNATYAIVGGLSTFAIGENIIRIKVTAEDTQVFNEYNIIIKRLSNDTSINSITFVDLNNQQIAMTFENNQWVCEVDNTVNRGTFNLSLGHDNATYAIVGGLSTFAIGENIIRIKVTAEDTQVFNEYNNIIIKRLPIIRTRVKKGGYTHNHIHVSNTTTRFTSDYIQEIMTDIDTSTDQAKRTVAKDIIKDTLELFSNNIGSKSVVFDNVNIFPHINNKKKIRVFNPSKNINKRINVNINQLENDEGFYVLLENENDIATITTRTGGVIEVTRMAHNKYKVLHDDTLIGYNLIDGDSGIFQSTSYTIGSVSGQDEADWDPPEFTTDALCIMEGQNVLTDKGYTKVENIQIGDCVNGTPVLHITKQMTPHKLIKFPQDCFGQGVPSKDVYLTHDHLVCDPLTKQLNNAIVYTLLNKNVVAVEPPCEAVYNFVFSDWKLLDIDGLRCESISPYTPQTIALGFKPEHEVEVNNASELMVYGDNIVPKVVIKEESVKSEIAGNALTV